VRNGCPDGAGARRLVATLLTRPGLHGTALIVVSGAADVASPTPVQTGSTPTILLGHLAGEPFYLLLS
jgi:hypothetical protein